MSSKSPKGTHVPAKAYQNEAVCPNEDRYYIHDLKDQAKPHHSMAFKGDGTDLSQLHPKDALRQKQSPK
jgi:hypothetical protein